MDNNMQSKLFRQKSVERVSSPEQLNDYMRVTSPAMWMVLGAVIALLAGLLILASVKKLETTLPVEARVDEGSLTAVVTDAVKEGMTIRVAGQEVQIETVYRNEAGQKVCTADLSAEDGVYSAEIVTDSISPIQFLLN